MMLNTSEEIEEKLLEILRYSSAPLTARDLGIRLRNQKIRIPNYEVHRHLRGLLRNGHVSYHRGRWSSNGGSQEPTHEGRVKPTSPPPFSPEMLRLLHREDGAVPSPPPSEVDEFLKTTRTDKAQKSPIAVSNGPWEMFRRLVKYYRQCIQNEEGADASAYHNQLFERFIYIRGVGRWYPRPGLKWRISLPLGPHMAPFLRILDTTGESESLVIGYPLQAIYIKKEGEPDIAIVRPIFFYYIEPKLSPGALVVSIEEPQPEVNLGWLDHTFSSNPKRQRNFLSACGFINRWQPNDEMPIMERGERLPRLENLVAALTSFMPERVRETLSLDVVPNAPLREPFAEGIYNRAVLMFARRTKYTQTLLKELTAIQEATDEDLNRTALRHIFIRDDKRKVTNHSDEVIHEEIVVDTNPLNAEQRRAVCSLLRDEIVVITGPPGTGKSQVVAATVANARLGSQSVLFASRNHKAIDAVFARLANENGLPMMVRTNSKQDPTLNYTFSHAIKEMMSIPCDPSAEERLARIKKEIAGLLKKRGREASYANYVASLSTRLGEKEEQLAYLARELPAEMVLYLNNKPQVFPTKAIQRMIRTMETMRLTTSRSKWFRKFLDTVRAICIQPWYQMARVVLSHIPGAPKLPFLGTPVTLRKLSRDLSTFFERAMEYSNLRQDCLPLELKAQEQPTLKDITQIVSDLSSRLAELAPRAISLDLRSRCGLQPNINREELDGLQAAMRAMQTGLAEGGIREETVRVLKKKAPLVLEHFPCWAVTNLSVGSRIPLVAGLFDLAIIDEASQSDIPSAIPILFRARRAGAVGDPFQLTHCSKLSDAKDTILRRQVGLRKVEDERFAYKGRSLFDLFRSTNSVKPFFLSDTYRNTADIACYSNYTFYGGRLRVATDQDNLIFPSGMKPGIHWSVVEGTIQSGGGSGCYCPEEVDSVVEIVRTILVENDFLGSLGVVTPFRQQANRLRDALFEGSIPYDLLTRSKVHVDTAHGFQGDERDVIIFSLCAGPDMPTGSLSFVRETGNLFNVAISRARAVLHVIGNREWARSCGIKHIQNLASPLTVLRPKPSPTPWYPHESPWEKILYEALVQAGLNPKPQFPVTGRRLDLALIRSNRRTLKIDIEVDGDCHRNPDGSRKIDDLWRDIQLQGMGWKVMRFWVYQLRENLDRCVKMILEAWNDHERSA